MPLESLEIVYEDNHCLAIAKPSGVPCAHFQGKEQKGDLLLTGSCSKCGHKVVRVLETSEVRSDNN